MSEEDKKALESEETKSLQSTSGKPTFHVKIYAPFHTYYDGVAESLSAENDTGPFDILPHHKNFITILRPCEVVVRADGEARFTISQAILLVKADEATVFLDA